MIYINTKKFFPRKNELERSESDEFAKMNEIQQRVQTFRVELQTNYRSQLSSCLSLTDCGATGLSDTTPQFRIGNEYADPDEEW